MGKRPQPKPVIRRRPKMSTTVAKETIHDLMLVCAETGLPNVGVTIDYVVKDWKRLKAAALQAAAPEAAA